MTTMPQAVNEENEHDVEVDERGFSGPCPLAVGTANTIWLQCGSPEMP